MLVESDVKLPTSSGWLWNYKYAFNLEYMWTQTGIVVNFDFVMSREQGISWVNYNEKAYRQTVVLLIIYDLWPYKKNYLVWKGLFYSAIEKKKWYKIFNELQSNKILKIVYWIIIFNCPSEFI